MRYKQNYLQKREQELSAQAAAGLLSERYAAISLIELHMTYYHRAVNPVLMERTLRFSPSSHARFHVRCAQSTCMDGGYDLAPVIAEMVRTGKRSAKGKLFCHGSNTTIGHGSIAYTVEIHYQRRGA